MPCESETERLRELMRLSLELGDPARDLVVLAEGNTSARIDAESFWVKASGTSLAHADHPGAYVAVRLAPLMATLREPGELDDVEAKRRLHAAAVKQVDPAHEAAVPSIETYVHAACLEVGGATFVAHTHPTALNALLCGDAAESAYGGVLFPDEAVVCGAAPLIVPYAEPGLALGRVTLARLEAFVAEHGEPPRTVLLLNHGLFTLGASADEARAITEMAVKAARIRLGALSTGATLRFLPAGQAARLYGRDDERARRERLAG
jgi:rhamnose utilization protein RhaD (predicted bifunctional aldolase and dehydrogenase)